MIRYVSVEELVADIELQVAASSFRWIYVHPPTIRFEPTEKPPFLPNDSNKRESVPKD